jgi:hypothetical protein
MESSCHFLKVSLFCTKNPRKVGDFDLAIYSESTAEQVKIQVNLEH